MASSNGDGSSSNGTLSPRSLPSNNGSSRDYDTLKQQYDKLNNDFNALRRQYDHISKELDYYLTLINQLESSSQDAATLRTKNQILEQDLQTIRNEFSEYKRRPTSFQENGNSESLFMLAMHNEAVREDYDTLRKRYDDLLTSHTQTIAKLEVSQDENLRLSKQYEELSQERNNLLREMGSQKQHLTKAYERVVRDCNKYHKKHEDAVQEMKVFKMKAGNEVQRLKAERNATMKEYNLVMSERDTVHKEMEKLSDENGQTKLKIKLLEADNKELMEEKQSLAYQMECLRREITSALHDRDKAIKEANDLREKFGGEFASKEDSQYLIKSNSLNLLENSDRNKEQPSDSRSYAQRLQRLDNLDQANQELESLRKSLDKTLAELTESKQEAEVSKKRRDWAFSERDKIVQERESIRTLCDNMRKERDRAVSDLAESLRESDAVKKHGNEIGKENKKLKEIIEAYQRPSNPNHTNTTSAISSLIQPSSVTDMMSFITMDHDEYESDTVLLEYRSLPSSAHQLLSINSNSAQQQQLRRSSANSSIEDLGFELADTRQIGALFSEECGVYVRDVRKGGMADGRLRVNDKVVAVNGVECGCAMRYNVLEVIRRAISDTGVVRLTVRRRRWSQSRVTRWVHTAKLAAGCHGLSLESGVYIAAISQGSLAAQDKTLVVGDRVLRINNISMGSIDSLHEALSLLNDNRADAVTLTTLKMSYLCGHEQANVFAPAQRYKKENRSSQTEPDVYCLYGSQQQQQQQQQHHQHNKLLANSTWLKEKFDMVVGRRPSKDRNRNTSDDKKKYRTSSPLDPNYDQEQALATLDSVLDYHGAPSLTVSQAPHSVSKQRAFTKKRSSKDKDNHPSSSTTAASSISNEKNGGTWPKARVSNSLLLGAGSGNAGGTIVHRKRERPPLSLLISEEYYTGGGSGQSGSGMSSRGGGNNLANPSNRNSTPVSTLVSNLLNQPPPTHPHRRSGVSFDHDYYPSSSSPSGAGAIGPSANIGAIGSVPHRRGPPPPPVSDFDHMKSDDSLDFPPLVTRGTKVHGGVMTLGRRAETPKYGSDCDRDTDRPISTASPSGVPPQLHHRLISSSGGSSHSHGVGPYGVPLARPLAFIPHHPHPHPHQHRQQQHQHILYPLGMTVSPSPLQLSHPTIPSPLLPTSSSSPHPSPSSLLSSGQQQHYPNTSVSSNSPMGVPLLPTIPNIPPPPRSQSRESFTSVGYDPAAHHLHHQHHQPLNGNHALVGPYVPYSSHSHSPSLLSSDGLSGGGRQVMMQRQQQQGFSGVVDYGGHQFVDYGGSGGGIGYSHKKEDPRFRVPSTPSLSMLSTTGSIERTINDGGPLTRPTTNTGGISPMPIFHVEVLSPGTSAGHSNATVSSSGGGGTGVGGNNGGMSGLVGSSTGGKNNRRSVPPGAMMGIVTPSNSLLQHQHTSTGSTSGGYYPTHSNYYYMNHLHPSNSAQHQLLDNTSSNSLQHQSQQQPHKPLPGELRRVHIDKSNEPLGIQINCPQSGGIFVSTVNEHSLASRVGLQIGDQLLEVCGINMRNATYNLAANVLRQCGNSITMLVQYSPDKYNELEGSATCSSSSSANDEEDNEPTPCNSPKEARKFQFHQDTLHTLSGLSSLSRTSAAPQSMMQKMQHQQSPGVSGQQQGGQVQAQIQQSQQSKQQQRQSMISTHEHEEEEEEPRYLYIETQKTSNLGITLVGGNAVGIFVHAVKSDSLAYHAGLRTGDQILEYNKSDLRHATAEEAAYELAKPADKVTVLAHYRIDRYNEIQDKPGDSFYVRCGFDRSGSEITDNMQLCFNKDEVLYVDNTMLMYNSSPGYWRAWKLDAEGHREMCGVIPSKYKVEEELLLRRSSGDLESRGSTTARRSFFRRNKKHQRNGSRDSKELASFCVTSGWYSDNGTLHEDLSLCSYQRVEQLDFPEYRPVLVLGPLAEYVVDKLVTDFPDKFAKIIPEKRQSALDEMADNVIVDYRRKGSYFECTTVSAIRNVCGERLHCMLDISISSIEKLHRYQIYPIVLLIKFKSTKQIKEVKDARYSIDKLTGKAAKEMYEHCQKIELEYKHIITAVIPAGVNIAYMCTQVKAAIDSEHNKSQWVTVQ